MITNKFFSESVVRLLQNYGGLTFETGIGKPKSGASWKSVLGSLIPFHATVAGKNECANSGTISYRVTTQALDIDLGIPSLAVVGEVGGHRSNHPALGHHYNAVIGVGVEYTLLQDLGAKVVALVRTILGQGGLNFGFTTHVSIIGITVGCEFVSIQGLGSLFSGNAYKAPADAKDAYKIVGSLAPQSNFVGNKLASNVVATEYDAAQWKGGLVGKAKVLAPITVCSGKAIPDGKVAGASKGTFDIKANKEVWVYAQPTIEAGKEPLFIVAPEEFPEADFSTNASASATLHLTEAQAKTAFAEVASVFEDAVKNSKADALKERNGVSNPVKLGQLEFSTPPNAQGEALLKSAVDPSKFTAQQKIASFLVKNSSSDYIKDNNSKIEYDKEKLEKDMATGSDKVSASDINTFFKNCTHKTALPFGQRAGFKVVLGIQPASFLVYIGGLIAGK